MQITKVDPETGKEIIVLNPTLNDLVDATTQKINLVHWSKSIGGWNPHDLGSPQRQALSMLIYLFDAIGQASKQEETGQYYAWYKLMLEGIYAKMIPLSLTMQYLAHYSPCRDVIHIWKKGKYVAKESPMPLAAEAEYKLLEYCSKKFPVIEPQGFLRIGPYELAEETTAPQVAALSESTPFFRSSSSALPKTIVDVLKASCKHFEVWPVEEATPKGYHTDALSVLFTPRQDALSIADMFTLWAKPGTHNRARNVRNASNTMLTITAQLHESHPEIEVNGETWKDKPSLRGYASSRYDYYLGNTLTWLVKKNRRTEALALAVRNLEGLLDVSGYDKDIIDDYWVINTDSNPANFLYYKNRKKNRVVRIDLASMINPKALRIGESPERKFDYCFFYNDLFHIFDVNEQLTIRERRDNLSSDDTLSHALCVYWISREKERIDEKVICGQSVPGIADPLKYQKRVNDILSQLGHSDCVDYNLRRRVERVLVQRRKSRLMEMEDQCVQIENLSAKPYLELDDNFFIHRYFRNMSYVLFIEKNDRMLPRLSKQLALVRKGLQDKLIDCISRHKDEQLQGKAEAIYTLGTVKNGESPAGMQDSFDFTLKRMIGYSDEDSGRMYRGLKGLAENINAYFDGRYYGLREHILQYVRSCMEVERLKNEVQKHFMLAHDSLDKAIGYLAANLDGKQKGAPITDGHNPYSIFNGSSPHLLYNGAPAFAPSSVDSLDDQFNFHIEKIKEKGYIEFVRIIQIEYLRAKIDEQKS
ncbi:MAG: hypothetical protein V1859_07040 [archaeon]